MKFKSAVDNWYYMTIVASVLIILAVVIPFWSSGQMRLPQATVLSVAMALPVILLFTTYYQVGDGQLIIRTGLFTWKIRLSDIQSARPSRSILSSPALSLNRLEIRYGNGKRVLVSPRDMDGFLRAIGQEKRVKTG